MTTFDSREHSWANLQLAVDGKMITRFTGLKFAIKKEKEYVHGHGENPLEIVSGNKVPEGEVTILGSQIEKFQEALAPDQDLTDAPPFEIVATLAPKRVGQKLVNFTLFQCEWLEDIREFKQGDKKQEYTLPIMFLKRVVN